ncbi:hypothetical protein F5Y17DRAFT_412227 [Xylariaceae sp. FL0594]|nr:hypothetical protein F5Y17DRAFT_412227 [Xylariaceae sp. FL0594]
MATADSADDDTKPAGSQSPETSDATARDNPADIATDNGSKQNTEGSATPGASTPSKDGNKKTPTRRRASTLKQRPTLLGDFLLGRQSPARLAAERKAAQEAIRQRRMSLEAVKHEMREAMVQRVQAPGGVRDRVTKWQKANAEAIARADPNATPTEPSEVNIHVEEESVTEEDRVRIKMRQKKRTPLNVVVAQKSTSGDGPAEEEEKKATSASPPKKRVVSDTNWVKPQKKKSPTRTESPKGKKGEVGGSPLPKDFLSRPKPNPPVSKKVEAWAAQVEIPGDPQKRPHTPKSVGSKSFDSGDGIRVKPMPAETSSDDDAASRRPVSATKSARDSSSRKAGRSEDDGIRVRPMHTKKSYTDAKSEKSDKTEKSEKSQKYTLPDDGIRVRPLRTPPREPTASRGVPTRSNEKTARPRPKAPVDDGIRVQPLHAASRDASTVRASSNRSSELANTRTTGVSRSRPASDRIEVIEVIEDSVLDQTEISTVLTDPTQVRTARPRKRRPRRAKSMAETGTTMTEDVSDSDSWTSDSRTESDIPSTVPPKPLADIPVGYSAFSELDLPSGASSRPTMRPKSKRQSSFKGATNVLLKALNEGRKILTEAVDPPRPVVNRPPNIENWLKETVDPFVGGQAEPKAEPRRRSSEKSWVDENKRRHSASSSRHKPRDIHEDDSTYFSPSARKATPKRDNDESSDRSRGPRSRGTGSPTEFRSRPTKASSPIDSPGKGFKEKFREAFRGESTAHPSPPLSYPSFGGRPDDKSERTEDYPDEDSFISEQSTDLTPVHPSAKRRPPPTNGFHQLSTIVSDAETLSAIESELTSVVSESTATQTTMTRSTGLTRSPAISRKKTKKPGLKRRLTKHSDLVSALSLPTDSATPSRNQSLRSARSVRRVSNHLDDATVEDLLQEFAKDEDLYCRELKTLVDGVIPVLLSQFVHGRGEIPRDVFGVPKGTARDDPLPKAVVDMGVELEKLRKYHRQCPLSDIHKLPQWLEAVAPVYERYLSVWRLGFQGVIVNLAPASPDDMDSLIGAMPRNEQGDVLNEHGDRIDVAHLLKRPLVRTKWITKFIQGYRAVTGTGRYESLATKWEALQNKARKRHKEEVARIVDEDARNTDTSRARDLKTMAAADHVRIDRFRQVYAKDCFSLDLQHSSGQRLECQVELVYRDNTLFKTDPGDLLIREIGSGGRSWLLFAPVTGTHVSARRGDKPHQLVLMIRGYKDAWYELLTLSTDNEEQVLDWLQIIGTTPVPPPIDDPPLSGSRVGSLSPSAMAMDMPVGERIYSKQPLTQLSTSSSEGSERGFGTPAKPHHRQPSSPTTPTGSASPVSSSGRTATQEGYAHEQRAGSFAEDRHSEPRDHNEAFEDPAPYREDGAPPPPKHRSFDAKNAPSLAAPVEMYSSLKRRNSSPLKHEYYPSDVSSESSFSTSGSEDDYSYSDESSDDELEVAELPDTAPAISVRRDDDEDAYSTTSRTVRSPSPSVRGSQASISDGNTKQPEYLYRSLATISYWDNKHGCWKDLWPDICSIVTTPGLIEAYPYRRTHTSSGEPHQEEERPLIALDLTPLVMLRTSTVLDLEIRSPVLSYARLYAKVNKIDTSFFRLRAPSLQECESLYKAVHRARLDNAKYKALEEETRIRAFGQNQFADNEPDGGSQRRSWFGRKNSYRASARAPSQSAGSTSHSSISASSFLQRLIGGGNQFDISKSSIGRQSRTGSGENSLYTLSSGSPRSPSVSAANSGGTGRMSLTTNNLKIRLHLLVTTSKWEDYGNCYLEVTRPDRGARQNLRKYQGMEKRIVVTSIPRKATEKPQVVLDVVLGTRCFSRLGSRGILLNVWEEVRDESGETGVAPKGGGSGGNVNKWCFQCASVVEASWIYGLVTQEVVIS